LWHQLRLRRHARHAAVLLFEKRHVIVAQAIIDRQLARHLPGVLNVAGKGMVAQPHGRLHAVVDGAGRTYKIAGVCEPGRCVRAPAILPVVRGLCLREGEHPVCPGISVCWESFKQRLTAEFANRARANGTPPSGEIPILSTTGTSIRSRTA